MVVILPIMEFGRMHMRRPMLLSNLCLSKRVLFLVSWLNWLVDKLLHYLKVFCQGKFWKVFLSFLGITSRLLQKSNGLLHSRMVLYSFIWSKICQSWGWAACGTGMYFWIRGFVLSIWMSISMQLTFPISWLCLLKVFLYFLNMCSASVLWCAGK